MQDHPASTVPGLEVAPLCPTTLAEYAAVPIAFEVDRRLVVDAADPLGQSWVETPVSPPYCKDYDAVGIAPLDWSTRFELGRWGLFAARRRDVVVGGAAVAPMGEVMADAGLAAESVVLWDLRVAPAHRRSGAGGALLHAAARWAATRGAASLLVETQDINVPACRFYAKHGFRLASYDRDAYDDAPGEARLVWVCEPAALLRLLHGARA